jgi:hypothetical protein
MTIAALQPTCCCSTAATPISVLKVTAKALQGVVPHYICIERPDLDHRSVQNLRLTVTNRPTSAGWSLLLPSRLPLPSPSSAPAVTRPTWWVAAGVASRVGRLDRRRL